MILVTGATGNIGSALLRRLAERDVAARALTRDASRAVVPAGVEVVEGDLGRPDSLRPAWNGVESVFFLPNGSEDSEEVLRSARQAGVRRVVMVSSLLAQTDPGSFIGRGALQGEQVLRDSGLSWTILRPWEFASNAIWWASSIREQGIVRATGGDKVSPVIDPADIAAVAARALTEPGHEEKIHPLTGPAEVSPRERVRLIGRELGRELEFEEMTAEEALQNLKRFMPAEVAESMAGDDTEGEDPGPGVLSTVEDVTGSPARTFQQWAHEHADAFR